MGWFKKKERVIDLTENYVPKKKINSEVSNDVVDLSSSNQSSTNPQPVSPFGAIFNAPQSSPSSTEEASPGNYNVEEKKRRLARRLKEMTDKMEDLSNQIYHLQQRIEVLERKGNRGY